MTGCVRTRTETSENRIKAKFAEIDLPRTPVNKGEKGRSDYATTLRLRAVFPHIRW
jgi:hypothetical protein